MEVLGFTPHRGQARAIETIFRPSKYITVRTPRQWGKTMLGINLLLYWAINDKGSKIMWIAPTYQQSTKVMKELISIIADSGIIKSKNLSDNEIHLKTGSSIYFRSAEKYDNLRGYTMDYMIVDEAAYIRDEAWKSALKPIVLIKGKKVVFFSTPRGRNFFYELDRMGLDKDSANYESFKGHYSDNPFVDPEEIESARKTLPAHIFKAEYEGEFVEGDTQVFNIQTANEFNKWPTPAGKVFCGVDLGRADDYTVATFMDSQGTVVDIYRDNLKDWSTMTTEILKRIKKWNATAMVEVNSIGDVIFEQIKKQWSDTHPVFTSSKTKPDMIEGLIVDLNAETVKIPSAELFPSLRFELDIFEYNYSPKSRTIQYSAPNGFHDDCVMSLAIANYNRKQNKTLGQYAVAGKRL